jgi:predicted acylesterase/phospholipase RssA
MSLVERLARPGPKRVLSLDGGGTRGIIALGFLEEIERVLCGDDPGARLADHFDLIGGTSTGAIIAAGLALGWRVEEIRARYMRFAPEVFRPRWQRWLLMNQYRVDRLDALLRSSLRPPGAPEDAPEVLLGGPELLTGLAIVMKRVDTGSPWVVSNLPDAPYFADQDGGANGNARIPLSNLVRASAAAPLFFEPAEFDLGLRADGTPERGRFVDGGVTPYNNPALRLLELARLPVFGLGWPLGRERLMIVSVGTGRYRLREPALPRARDAPIRWLQCLPSRLPLLQAIFALRGAIMDGESHALRSLQALGWSPAPVHLDGEVGRMEAGGLLDAPLFTVLRYDLDFDAMARNGAISAKEAAQFQHFDAPGDMARLHQLACAAAGREVVARHLQFPGTYQ